MPRLPRSISRSLLLIGLVALLPAVEPDAPSTPEQRTDEAAVARHAEYLTRVAAGGAGVELLFLGDSITDGYRNASSWQHLVPLGALDFGMWGDGTQHLLWRLGHGELAGLTPKVVVLMIGTNDLGRGFTPAAVAAGVAANLRVVTTACPQARVVLMGVLPQDHASAAGAAEISAINALLAPLADGRTIRFLDIGDRLRTADGGIRAGMYRDNIHPADPGYAEWTAALLPVLSELGLKAPAGGGR